MTQHTFQRIKDVPVPKDEMFIWAYWSEGRWRVGLAYQNVSGSWSDAYSNPEVPKRATHWAPMPEPPEAPSRKR